MKLPDLRQLPATAKAQAWGLLVSFALALWASDRMGLSLAAFFLGFLGTWVAWEMFYGLKLAARLGQDMRAVVISLLLGLAIPWGGFAFAYALYALRG
jgi:hypothetical protein